MSKDIFSSITWLEDLIKDSTKELTKERDALLKKTKEELVKQIMTLTQRNKELESKLSQNEAIAKAIRDGVERVNTINTQSGITINRDTAVMYATNASGEVAKELKSELDKEKQRLETAYTFLDVTKKYKLAEGTEMYALETRALTDVNPYAQTEEWLDSMIKKMQTEMHEQRIFNKGYTKGIEDYLRALYKLGFNKYNKLTKKINVPHIRIDI